MLSFAARAGWRQEWRRAAITLPILTVATFVWVGEASAGDIVIKIIDYKGSPVVGAEVQLDPLSGGRRVTKTANAAGRYVLLDVMPGKYRLTCGGSFAKEIDVGISVDLEECQR
jgi:Carboxypeptidase regulatory-like domain